MMRTKKPENADWLDNVGAKIEISPDYLRADQIRLDAEATLITAAPGTFEYDNAIDTLRQLWAQDIIDCDHSYTEQVSVDDTLWLEEDGVHSRTNEDQTRCLVCGAIYIESEDRWEQQ